MSFTLTDEQRLLKESAAAFVRERSSLRRIRALRDSNDPDGFSRDLWREMAELGWLGIIFPEELGGLGLGYKDLAFVLEEMGRGLMPEPWLSTVLLGGGALRLGGTAEHKKSVLPAVIAGERLLALAYQEEKSRYDLGNVTTRAERDGTGWRISGEKRFVLDGHVADQLLVSARTGGATTDRKGITLFLVDRRTPGVRVTPGVKVIRQQLLDGRNAAIVQFEGVQVDGDGVVGNIDGGAELLSDVIDRATVGLCAEMQGSLLAAFDMTLEYLKTREQFGVQIGSFQALKHRAAQMFVETELIRSAVMAAAMALDESSPRAAQFVSVAKARCSDAFVLIANEAVQMHGGIGMTDEHDVGFFIKRARVAEMTFGDAAFHRNRFAELAGY